MDYMQAAGFFGTEAPFFMDMVTLIVAGLPLLILLGVKLLHKEHYALHIFYQAFLFLVTVIVVIWFEIGVKNVGGFTHLIDGSMATMAIKRIILISHIAISVVATIYWGKVIVQAYINYRNGSLPGGFTLKHARQMHLVLLGIALTALSGIAVYIMLFVI
ncbi:MAG: DUF420 domain-containing protein [Sulfurovum sp.]|nr:DUF420 domain-containing protein [Sulfurovum sp.]